MIRQFTFVTTSVAICVAVVAAQSQQLPDEEVALAIRNGAAGKSLLSDCVANSAFLDLGEWSGAFSVVSQGAAGRIMWAARAAKEKYLPFTMADVTPEMRTQQLVVTAVPAAPVLYKSTWRRAPPVTHMVLKSKPPKGHEPIVLQPISMTLTDHEWSNAMGGKWTGIGAVAVFDFAAFQAIPHEDIDVALVTDAGERRCKIGYKDRKKLR